jgi:PIN domain nuclease of toxin-antitoxin system
MKYLVDTNAWIGFFEGSADFGAAAKRTMSTHPEDCLISVASVWEASIKTGLGKLALPYDIRTDLPVLLEENGFTVLPVAFDDATGVVDLPRHHGDPFDRLMAVQALRRNLGVISRDPIFEPYGLRRIW